MSKAKILAFAAILSFVGASNVLARADQQQDPCYRVKQQPGKAHWQLEIRKTNDLKEKPELLTFVQKFQQHKVETSGLLWVTTIRSNFGGPPATPGWIEDKFRGDPVSCIGPAFRRPPPR